MIDLEGKTQETEGVQLMKEYDLNGIKAIHVDPYEYPLIEGGTVAYVLCEKNGKKVLFFAGAESTKELSHTGLMELAEELDLGYDEEYAVGGGHISLKTGMKIRDSHAYGGISERLLDQFLDFLEERQNDNQIRRRRNY